MRRLFALVALALVALTLAACGGGGDGEDGDTTTGPTTPAPAPSQAPGEGATPPNTGQLPPGLVECFADKGIEIKSPDEIHSAPPEVVQECFSALHGGGGGP